jgi:hypothetical protein
VSAPRGEPEGPEAGSGLSALRRLRLYARNPRDAFAITSSEERRRDAILAFVLYFVVKTPVLLQRSAALKRFDKLDAQSYALGVLVGVLGGVVATLVLLVLVGFLLHLLVNVALGARGSAAEARRLPALCLAPQLILVAEFPSLLFDFRDYATFLVFLVLRLVADVLSARMFYWGLRSLFGLSPRTALNVTVLPIAALLVLFLPYILAPLR